jgi:hypothetical protein
MGAAMGLAFVLVLVVIKPSCISDTRGAAEVAMTIFGGGATLTGLLFLKQRLVEPKHSAHNGAALPTSNCFV